MPQKIRPIRVEGNIAYVPLTKGKEAIIDADDVPIAGHLNWYAMVRSTGSYAMRAYYSGTTRRVLGMHRVIMGDPEGMDIDHIDGDGLNNRKANLRVVTTSQNLCNTRLRSDNTSGYKGVSFRKKIAKWEAYIRVDGKHKALGLFNCPTSAHAAYAKASKELHGEYGRLS